MGRMNRYANTGCSGYCQCTGPRPGAGQDSEPVAAKFIRQANGTRGRCGKVQGSVMTAGYGFGTVDDLAERIAQATE
jgi:hypothetical protein